MVFRFEHETANGREGIAVQIRIPHKFMAEQYLFDFAKKGLTTEKPTYNKRTTWNEHR